MQNDPLEVPKALDAAADLADSTTLVDQIVGHRLRKDDLRSILDKLSSTDREAFTGQLAKLLHRTSSRTEVRDRKSVV